MDMSEKLKKAGYDVPDKPSKIDKSKVSMKLKINEAEKILRKLEEYENRRNSAPDKETFELIENSIVLTYQRFCDALKDILDIIAHKENVTGLSDKRGFGELIRKTNNILNVDQDVKDATAKLITRNEAVHDYINVGYYNNIILTHVSNDITEYKIYFNLIKQYFLDKGMINN